MAAPRTTNNAPAVIVLGMLVAGVLAYLRYPSVPALWLACAVAASFSSPPIFTGPKDAAGSPTPIGGEQQQMLRWRRWRLLRRAVFPSAAWLPNRPWGALRPGERFRQAAASLPMKKTAPVAAAAGRVVAVLFPARTATLVALGAAMVAWTAPVDALLTQLPWLNAIAAYAVIVGWDYAVRGTADTDDVAPSVFVDELLVERDAESAGGFTVKRLIASAVGGGSAAWAAYLLLRAAAVTWLFEPAPLLYAGCGVLVFGVITHVACRGQVRQQWRETIAARAQWASRWQTLKQDVRLLEHDTRPGATVTLFDAPATLGAAGAQALTAKLTPFLGTGVQFSLLPAPVPGSGGASHPTQFRAVVLDDMMRPDVADNAAAVELLGLWCEVAAANAVRTGLGQTAPAPVLRAVRRITTSGSPVVVWEALFVGNPADAIASGIRSVFGVDAVPVPPSAAGTAVVFGDVDVHRAEFEEPERSDQLAALAWELRWKQRWRDIFKTNERSVPVPQWQVKQEAVLTLPDGDVTIHSAPHMSAQGDQIGLYMSSVVAQKLPTTLNSAPFCTVIGWGDGSSPGTRNPQAFTVLWSDRPVPKDPTLLPGNVSKVAAKWALAASINAGFDAAKLPRPEVALALPMTRRGSESIWKVSLRLYDGVTLDAVKRALTKMRLQMGDPRWLIATRGEFGCDLFVGAHPSTEGLRFVSRATQQQCTVADLEHAFTAAGLDSPFDGSAPTLLEVSELESNPQVTRMRFGIPARMGLASFQEQKAIDKLRTATGNAFFEVRPADSPTEFVVLASEADPMPSPAPFMWDIVGAHERRVPFATRVEGSPCVWDLENDSHLLVLGQNGSGKGIAMTAIAAPMLVQGWDTYAADPIKGFNDFAPFDPWLRARCTTYEQTAALMKHLVGVIEERRDLNAQHGVSNVRDLPEGVQPPMSALFLDEFTSLVIPEAVQKPPAGADEVAMSEYEQAARINELKATIAAGLGRLVREGRATGMVVVAAGQKLTSDLLKRIPGGATIKSQFSRLAMGKMSFGDLTSAFSDPQAAMGILGDSVPRGRGVFESTSEAPFAVQTWWGGGSQHDHFAQIVEHISAVRVPLTDGERLDVTAADSRVSFAPPAAPTFGEPVGRVLVDEPVVDLGEVDLSLDFSFDDPPADAPESTALPSAVVEQSLHDEADAPVAPRAESINAGVVSDDRDDDRSDPATSSVLLWSDAGQVISDALDDGDLVDQVRAFLDRHAEVRRLVVADERAGADWVPGVPVATALEDLGRRRQLEVRASPTSSPKLLAWLRESAATAIPSPVAVSTLPVPKSTPAPAVTPWNLFAAPPEPIVPSNGVRFD